MRISTNQIFDQNLAAMLNQQSALANTQNQLSTGKKIINPSDDPAGSVQILNLQREFSLNEQYLANADVATSKLQGEEATIQSVVDLMQRVRELGVQGLNGTYTQADRQAIAAELRQIGEQIFALSNTRDANGDYIFSGYANDTQPYENISGSYQGDEGQRNIKVGSGVLIASNDPANQIFEAARTSLQVTDNAPNATLNILDVTDVPDSFSEIIISYDGINYSISDATGNSADFNYQDPSEISLDEIDSAFPPLKLALSGSFAAGESFVLSKEPGASQTIFKTINDFADALSSNNVNAGDSPNNGDVLINIDAALAKMTDGQARIGSRINVIEQQQQINESLSVSLEKDLSAIKDLDYAEAISRLTRQSIGLQAAQQSFAQVQRLSLFNFL